MKLTLQIALGVFLGTLAAQLLLDNWHKHQAQLAQIAEQQRLIEQENARLTQADRVRALFLQSQQQKPQSAQHPPIGFVPDDATPIINR